MAGRIRPTMRCLREDLEVAVPTADTPQEEISHPLLTKAAEYFPDDQAPRERIVSIDDRVLFKVKVQRWYGAVWVDDEIPWLVAAGQREEGSHEGFYASLTTRQDCTGTVQRRALPAAGQYGLHGRPPARP